MTLVVDTKEQDPLEFGAVVGVEVVKEAMNVGDYTAKIGDRYSDTVIERKSVSDLFGSFSSNYEAERNKIIRASMRGVRYVLAVEAPLSEIRKGHSYWKDGESHESKKSGISQIRQLMTIERKYNVPVWYCVSRAEMAFRIQEFFLAWERSLENETKA